ncbi:PorT family protein [Lacibacter luteus]|uniref:PorT family protein n=1 Tax=Lacibacter luteus TaxID=2508719 RepID=A0A4Q1CKJ8_9BACT|nr:porin family protein [Lacibacter luteus]RXK61477.1 PorT family protein [Lacibacter luteus]
MKKIFALTAALFLFAGLLNAQNSSFGFHAGMAMSKISAKSDNISFTTDDLFALQAGFVVDLPIGKRISLQPGLSFLQKGGKTSEEYAGITEESKIRINYIEIPMNVLFNARTKSGTFFVGAGPSVSFAMSGKSIYKFDGQEDKEKINIGNDEENDDMRGLDFGINTLAGYRFKSGLFLGASYNWGLRNLNPGGNKDDGTAQMSYYGVRLGFMIGGK